MTFDDVLLVPGYSEILPRDAALDTPLSKEIRLNIPFVSAAMDTVTESRLAICMAQEGGLGVIHKNMPIEDQAQEVRIVKKFESGVIQNPITVGPDATIRDVLMLTRTQNISGVPNGSFVLFRKDAGVKVPWDEALRILDVKDILATVEEHLHSDAH